MKHLQYKRFWLVLLTPVSYGLVIFAKQFPSLTERFYTRGLYQFLANLLGRLMCLLPFSFTSLALLLLPATLLYWVIRKLFIKNEQPIYIGKRKRKRVLIEKWIATLLAGASCIYFSFVLFCAPNYHRLTFAQQSGLEIRPSSTEELMELCRHLADDANALRIELPMDENGVMKLEVTPRQLAKQAQLLYPNAAAEYPMLDGYVARPKPFLFSRTMSWLNITGIYIPWFFEPNVNVDVEDYTIPATMMHEMSHFKGYMREDEANFLAYLTCKYSDDPVFAYSGTMMALSYSSSALYHADPDLYFEIMGSLSVDVRADMAASRAYWQQFEGPVGDVSTAMNNVYLKSNNQKSGVKSYGEMVDLLLAEHRLHT